MGDGIGHNSTSSEILLETVCRVEKLIEDRKAITEDIKATMDAAEGQGLEKKTIREMIRLRALDAADRREAEELRELYKAALGLE